MPINPAPLHTIDLIRKKRDGGALDAREIGFMVAGATSGSIPAEQLAAWLMAAFLRGLSLDETRALTLAMRDSNEKFSPARLGKVAVDKHSTGGVGDKTSFLVAPIAAACGLAVPMISGRALGHTGGTLDKLESIPGYRTTLSLDEFETVLSRVARPSSARPRRWSPPTAFSTPCATAPAQSKARDSSAVPFSAKNWPRASMLWSST